MKITDEMVDAAIDKWFTASPNWREDGKLVLASIWRDEMRVALTAALATQPDHGVELVRLTAEVARLREATQSMLAAMIEDYGNPDDFPGDDGPVGVGVDSHTFITFNMMREWRAALEATNDPR